MLLILTGFLAGTAAAEVLFSTGGAITTSTSVSVQGTVNETVSLTKKTIGSTDKTVLSNSYTMLNPSSLTWHSHLTLNSDNEAAWVDYVREGGLPRISWKQYFSR